MAGRSQPHAKSSLRDEFRQRRRELGAADRESRDEIIRRTLLDLPDLPAGTALSAFWPFDGEPDLRPVLESLHARGVNVFLPLIPDTPDAGLEMHPWEPGSRMLNGRLGIFEPAAGSAAHAVALDVVLMPLVAFDLVGRRLGMGAGYYDRYLAPVRALPAPLRIGVAYSVQQAEELPADAWDVPLHGVITDHGWTTFGPV